jgi:dienelactone hydrolase
MKIARATKGAIALAACLFFGTAGIVRGEIIKVPHETRGKHITLLADLRLPKNVNGKLPAIILSHGSGGVRAEREYAYARAFNEWGVAAVVVDSFGPRGIHSTVSDQSPVSAVDMLGDAVAVLKAAARHPAIDPTRIALIGFSKGGTVAVKAALRRYMAPLAKDEAQFRSLIALYPWCGDMPLDFTPAGASLLMLLGGNDTYVGTAACLEYAEKFEKAGGKLSLKIYPAAKHGWDVPGQTDWHVADGENFRKCIYDEVKPGRWIERTSRLMVFDNNAPTADLKKTRCITRGVAGGYDKESAHRSLQEIRATVRAAFRLE